MKYSLIIPMYNNLESCTKPCIDSIKEYTILDPNFIEIILVANGCTDGTNTFIYNLEEPYFKKLIFSDPLGYTKAVNEGMREARGEYIILMNNDIVLLPQEKNTWLKMLTDPFDLDPTVGVTGPLKAPAIKNREKESIIFFLAMFKKELYEKIGPLDEIFSPGSGEDYDFCIKAANLGYKLVQVPDEHLSHGFVEEDNNTVAMGGFPIYHKAEQTVHKLSGWDDVIKRNSKILSNRYNCIITLGEVHDEHPTYKGPDILKEEKTIVEPTMDNRDLIEIIREDLAVTAYTSTKDRYFTTLPTMITSIANQTLLPKKLIIFDDGEQKNLLEESVYKNLFSLLSAKGIEWTVLFGQRKGQVYNHQAMLEIAETPLIWRIDDDDAPEANVLEILVEHFSHNPNLGAVSCQIIDPKVNKILSPIASNKIEDIYMGMNIQWYHHEKKRTLSVDHLYNSFVINVEHGRKVGGYFTDLSPACHREETIFTYKMKRAGFDILFDPLATIWHLREDTGGIRSYNNHPEFWEYDEKQFSKFMQEWEIKPSKFKFAVLENGAGDHIAFKFILPEFREKYKDHKIILATCYPDIFADEDVTQISIAEAHEIFQDLSQFNIYKFMIDNNWKQSVSDAYRKMYL